MLNKSNSFQIRRNLQIKNSSNNKAPHSPDSNSSKKQSYTPNNNKDEKSKLMTKIELQLDPSLDFNTTRKLLSDNNNNKAIPKSPKNIIHMPSSSQSAKEYIVGSTKLNPSKKDNNQMPEKIISIHNLDSEINLIPSTPRLVNKNFKRLTSSAKKPMITPQKITRQNNNFDKSSDRQNSAKKKQEIDLSYLSDPEPLKKGLAVQANKKGIMIKYGAQDHLALTPKNIKNFYKDPQNKENYQYDLRLQNIQKIKKGNLNEPGQDLYHNVNNLDYNGIQNSNENKRTELEIRNTDNQIQQYLDKDVLSKIAKGKVIQNDAEGFTENPIKSRTDEEIQNKKTSLEKPKELGTKPNYNNEKLKQIKNTKSNFDEISDIKKTVIKQDNVINFENQTQESAENVSYQDKTRYFSAKGSKDEFKRLENTDYDILSYTQTLTNSESITTKPSTQPILEQLQEDNENLKKAVTYLLTKILPDEIDPNIKNIRSTFNNDISKSNIGSVSTSLEFKSNSNQGYEYDDALIATIVKEKSDQLLNKIKSNATTSGNIKPIYHYRKLSNEYMINKKPNEYQNQINFSQFDTSNIKNRMNYDMIHDDDQSKNIQNSFNHYSKRSNISTPQANISSNELQNTQHLPSISSSSTNHNLNGSKPPRTPQSGVLSLASSPRNESYGIHKANFFMSPRANLHINNHFNFSSNQTTAPFNISQNHSIDKIDSAKHYHHHQIYPSLTKFGSDASLDVVYNNPVIFKKTESEKLSRDLYTILEPSNLDNSSNNRPNHMPIVSKFNTKVPRTDLINIANMTLKLNSLDKMINNLKQDAHDSTKKSLTAENNYHLLSKFGSNIPIANETISLQNSLYLHNSNHNQHDPIQREDSQNDPPTFSNIDAKPDNQNTGEYISHHNSTLKSMKFYNENSSKNELENRSLNDLVCREISPLLNYEFTTDQNVNITNNDMSFNGNSGNYKSPNYSNFNKPTKFPKDVFYVNVKKKFIA